MSLFLLIVAGCAQGDTRPKPESIADTILANGRIYTVDDDQPWAESIAIKGDRIVAVGALAIDKEAGYGQDRRAGWTGMSFSYWPA